MHARLAIDDPIYLGQERRSDFDVTNTVRVSSVRHTCAAVGMHVSEPPQAALGERVGCHSDALPHAGGD
jgi:hypothetical protein